MSYSYWALRGHCSNCRYFEYEGEYAKGYCSWHRAYYHNDETCDHQEDRD